MGQLDIFMSVCRICISIHTCIKRNINAINHLKHIEFHNVDMKINNNLGVINRQKKKKEKTSLSLFEDELAFVLVYYNLSGVWLLQLEIHKQYLGILPSREQQTILTVLVQDYQMLASLTDDACNQLYGLNWLSTDKVCWMDTAILCGNQLCRQVRAALLE